jgi:cytochrome bd-type quinol oxidase subunit 2
MNWLAILCAGVAYWVLGFVWYSLLFGKAWAAELARHRGERPAPSGREMGAKMIGTFVCNLIAAGAMAYLFHRTGITDMSHAFRLAAAAGIGFAGTALTMAYIWESKPSKVWAIDVGFNFLGSVLLALILVSWP